MNLAHGRTLATLTVLFATLCVGTAVAQSTAGGVAATAPVPATSAPASPASPASAPVARAGRGKASWWGNDVTPGWSLMSWAERNDHRKHMRAMKTYEECKTYLDQHHERMMARAKERGQELKATPRDACERLKP